MDFLMFFVALGFLVEATRATIQKFCVGKRKGSKSLEEPLVPHVAVDEFGNCILPCCAPLLVNAGGVDTYEGFEEYYLETSEEESLDSPERLRTTTDDSEDFEEHVVKTVDWEDLLDNASVTLVGDRGRSLKGKEIVEEQEEEITLESDSTRSDMLTSRLRKPSRGRNSAKVYPESLDSPSASLQAAYYESMSLGQISDEALKITDQSAWDANLKSDVKVITFTGESSKS